MPRCFVMQPFDGGEFDRRFDEVYKLAIVKAGFEPYRVDRDAGASIPIESIESGIRGSVACFADITNDNPNVWFELGFAICAQKPMCLVCGSDRQRFPFDIQHRKIIKYKTTSPSDFSSLSNAISERLSAILEQNATIEEIIREPTKSSGAELGHLEFSALCLIFENQEPYGDGYSVWSFVNDMERAGFTKIAAKIALRRLEQANMILGDIAQGGLNGDTYCAYSTTETGENYILNNESRIELRRKTQKKLNTAAQLTQEIGDDIPF